jgi:hypothetical protein
VNLYAILRRSGWKSAGDLEEAGRSLTVGKHAQLDDLPVDEIIPIADTVILRPDPQPVAA